MKFSEHGKFEIYVEDNLLIVETRGPFNEEVAKRYLTSVNEAVTSLAGRKWQQIIMMHEEGLMTPEAEEILKKSIASRKVLGLTYSAVVLGNAQGKTIIRHQLSGCYQSSDVEFGFFETVQDAKQALTSQ